MRLAKGCARPQIVISVANGDPGPACGRRRLRLLLVSLSSAATPLTADQQLVAGLESTECDQVSVASLAKPSPDRAKQARADIGKALTGVTATTKAPKAIGARHAVGPLDALTGGEACASGKGGRHGRSLLRRPRQHETIALTKAALGDFGVPLEKVRVACCQPELRLSPAVRELLRPVGDRGQRGGRGRDRGCEPRDRQRRRAGPCPRPGDRARSPG